MVNKVLLALLAAAGVGGAFYLSLRPKAPAVVSPPVRIPAPVRIPIPIPVSPSQPTTPTVPVEPVEPVPVPEAPIVEPEPTPVVAPAPEPTPVVEAGPQPISLIGQGFSMQIKTLQPISIMVPMVFSYTSDWTRVTWEWFGQRMISSGVRSLDMTGLKTGDLYLAKDQNIRFEHFDPETHELIAVTDFATTPLIDLLNMRGSRYVGPAWNPTAWRFKATIGSGDVIFDQTISIDFPKPIIQVLDLGQVGQALGNTIFHRIRVTLTQAGFPVDKVPISLVAKKFGSGGFVASVVQAQTDFNGEVTVDVNFMQGEIWEFRAVWGIVNAYGEPLKEGDLVSDWASVGF